MKTQSCLIVLGLVVSAQCVSFYSVVMEEWAAFKVIHNKKYKSDIEESFRMKIFMQNKEHIASHNKLHALGKKSYKLQMNQYGDLLHNEFVSVMNGFHGFNLSALRAHREQHAATFIEPDDSIVLPSSIDWREKGAVTPIKDQGQCGSCWAFSATGALEGQTFRKTGQLVSLSEQNLVDCSSKEGNHGCNGGLMDYAFQYVKDNGGIDTEEDYPYDAEQHRCHYDPNGKGATDKGYMDIRQGNEKALKKAVATVGPVSVAIDASHQSFQFYSSGVYDEEDCDSEQLDHGVLVVGYGAEGDTNFWLVKNSWGTSWGLNGYIMMSRENDNQCGIATAASYPLV